MKKNPPLDIESDVGSIWITWPCPVPSLQSNMSISQRLNCKFTPSPTAAVSLELVVYVLKNNQSIFERTALCVISPVNRFEREARQIKSEDKTSVREAE